MSGLMNELIELHRFNAWANRSLLAGVRQLSAAQLEERRDGMYGTILGVLAHLAQVEAVYLAMMRDGAAIQPSADTLAETEEVLERTDAGLVELAGSADPGATFHVPWFGRDFTVPQGLRQVLTHSANHRADINQWLPWFGVDSTRQDYVLWVLEGA
jgi:uncharacterized damage-inducible protein DinB